MPVRTTAEQATEKWVQRLGQAGPAITAGVARVQTAPGAMAAQKFDKWLAAITDQTTQQKWRRNVARVSLTDWQNAMNNVGIQRVAAGAQAKAHKMNSFMQDFLPHLERGVSQIDRMPDVTYEQRKAKAIAMMDHNHTFRRGGTAGGTGA